MVSIDTIKVGYFLPEKYYDPLMEYMDKLTKVDHQGNEQFRITTRKLKGSFDSSISVRVGRMLYNDDLGESEFEIIIEFSLSKYYLGHNLTSDVNDPNMILKALNEIFHELGLPGLDLFFLRVYRVDLAELFKVGFNIKKYIIQLANFRYQRYRVNLYKNGETLYINGSMVTFKVYSKHEEFMKHDFKRLNGYGGNKLDLERLVFQSKGLVRFEIEIKNKKLKKMGIRNLDDLIRRWEDMKIVYVDFRNRILGAEKKETLYKFEDVKSYIFETFPKRSAGTIYNYYLRFSNETEQQLKYAMSSTTYGKYKKLFQDHGLLYKLNHQYVEFEKEKENKEYLEYENILDYAI